MRVSDAFPQTVADAFAKDFSEEDHPRDKFGKFARTAGGPKVPDSVASNPGDRHGIFMIGGSGSGKGGFVRGYIGNRGEHDAQGNVIDEDHKDFVAPHPGFENAKVFDADAEKKRIPGYDPGDPSGPLTREELLAHYDKPTLQALQSYVKANTPFKGIRHFADAVLGSGEHYRGGIVHELSSYVTRRNFEHHLDQPDSGHFVYDGTGSKDYMDWAKRAHANGMRVTMHHVDTDAPVAMYRNSTRDRNVAEHIAANTHRKVKENVPIFQDFVRNHPGDRMHFIHSKNSTPEQLLEAYDKGYTENGHEPAKARKRAKALRAALDPGDGRVL
jgi:hypothetical protein